MGDELPVVVMIYQLQIVETSLLIGFSGNGNVVAIYIPNISTTITKTRDEPCFIKHFYPVIEIKVGNISFYMVYG